MRLHVVILLLQEQVRCETRKHDGGQICLRDSGQIRTVDHLVQQRVDQICTGAVCLKEVDVNLLHYQIDAKHKPQLQQRGREAYRAEAVVVDRADPRALRLNGAVELEMPAVSSNNKTH